MSKRTKLKMRNAGLFLTKNVFNSRYIVRNIMAMTLIVTMVALGFGASIVIKENIKKGKDVSETTEQVVSSDVTIEEVVTVQASAPQMNVDSIDMLRVSFDDNLQVAKEARESEMVASAASFADKFVVIQDNVNVRQEANTDSAIVGKMNTGVCGDVVATEGEWIQIKSGEVEGYVRADFVMTGTDAFETALKYYAATATATEDGVCLRAAASKEAEVVGAVYENITYTVKPEKTTADWVCVESEGTEGYVFAEYMVVNQGFPVATKVEGATGNTMEIVETSGAVSKKEDMTVTEVSTQAQTTEAPTTQAPTTQATTQAPTTQATTQAPTTQVSNSNEANIGVTSRTPVSLSDADINLMAAVMTLECGGEPYEGQLAVANVILNRYQSGRYGSSMHDVLYAPYQFSVVSDPRLQNLIDNGAQASCIQAAREACAGTNNIGDLYGFRPTWNIDTSTVNAYKQIGNHVFFK